MENVASKLNYSSDTFRDADLVDEIFQVAEV